MDVPLPMIRKRISAVPAGPSARKRLNGRRRRGSVVSDTRIMTNWPGRAASARAGASRTRLGRGLFGPGVPGSRRGGFSLDFVEPNGQDLVINRPGRRADRHHVPTSCPISARPIGDSIEMRPRFTSISSTPTSV